MKRIFYISILALLVLSGIAAISCGTSATPTPGGNTTIKPPPGGTTGPDYTPGLTAAVIIDNFAFSPATLTITAGTTVTWTNKDSAPHTVVSLTKAFESGSMSTGGTYSFTFKDKGSYDYRCGIHPGMTGKIIVQ